MQKGVNESPHESRLNLQEAGRRAAFLPEALPGGVKTELPLRLAEVYNQRWSNSLQDSCGHTDQSSRKRDGARESLEHGTGVRQGPGTCKQGLQEAPGHAGPGPSPGSARGCRGPPGM